MDSPEAFLCHSPNRPAKWHTVEQERHSPLLVAESELEVKFEKHTGHGNGCSMDVQR
jgi:hypothetical protein